MGIRVFSFLFSILLVAFPLVQGYRVLKAQGISSSSYDVVRSDTDTSEVIAEDESGELGIVSDETRDFSESSLTAAPGVDTICVFPKNPTRLVPAGEETELLVGVHNQAESTLNILAIRASLHFPFDHQMLVQNLTVAEFYKATVPASAQAAFPYVFAVSKYLQAGSFDLVGTIIYEVDQHPYQNVFYNGTVEVVETSGIFSVESVFLVTLGAALLGLLGMWAYGQIQHFSKKTKRASKVEVGTRTTEANMDEWLEGTAYAKSLSNKSKKKN